MLAEQPDKDAGGTASTTGGASGDESLLTDKPHVVVNLPKSADRWVLFFEPAARNSGHSKAIPGSKQDIQIVAGFQDDSGLRAYTKEEFAELGVTWEVFVRIARKNLAKLHDEVVVRQLRTGDDDLLAYHLSGDSPVLAGICLAPDFLLKYGDQLGPAPLVLIPNSREVFIVPRSQPLLDLLKGSVVKKYRGSDSPISMEIYLIQPSGINAVGQLTAD